MSDSPEVKELCRNCEKRIECLHDGDDHHVVLVGGEPHCIAVKPLTVLLPNTPLNIQVPAAVEIGSPATSERAKAMKQEELDWLHEIEANILFDKVFKSQDISMPKKISELRQAGGGVMHIVGMIDMIVRALLDGKRIFLQHPETHLHPKAQAGLADMLVYIVRMSEEAQKQGGQEAPASE